MTYTAHIQTAYLRTVVKNALACYDPDNAKDKLRVAELAIEDGAFRIVTTDSFVLLVQRCFIADQKGEPPDTTYTVDLAILNAVLGRIYPPPAGQIELTFDAGEIVIDHGSFAVTLSDLAVDYMNWQGLLDGITKRTAVPGEFQLGLRTLEPLGRLRHPLDEKGAPWCFKNIGPKSLFPLYATSGQRGDSWFAELAVMPVRMP